MLQLIAMISMFIDHLGVCYGEQLGRFYFVCRCVGRLAMPLYAYFCVSGYRHSHDKWAYIFRQFIIGAFAEIAFIRIAGCFKLNICFVWGMAAGWLYAWEHRQKWIKFIYSLGLAVVFCLIPFDYFGFVPFVWVLLFYFVEDWLVICLLAVPVSFFGQYQLFALAAVPLIAICHKYKIERIKNKNIKYIWRWFYPAHMYLLGGVTS